MAIEDLVRRFLKDQVEPFLAQVADAIEVGLVTVQAKTDPVLAQVSDAIDNVVTDAHAEATRAISRASGVFQVLAGEAPRSSNPIETDPTLRKLDAEYQRFMRRYFDPLFGRARSQQLEEVTWDGEVAISDHEKSLNRRLGFTAAALVSVGGSALFCPPLLRITAPASFILAIPVFKKAYYALTRERRVNYHVLSAINVTGIWLGGFYVPATTSMLFYYLGEKLLVITQERSHKGLIDIFAQHPRRVWVLTDAGEVEIPFDDLRRGDVVVVTAGQVMPVNGTIIEGFASIDQHMLTGESQPKERGPGDVVYASTLVLSGRVRVRVDQAGEETVAARIGAILNRTAGYQMSLQTRGTALAHASALPTLLLGAYAGLTLGPESGLAILNSSFGVNIRITAPIAMLNFLNISSRQAMLIKDGRSLELLREVDTVLFDKTGTLTLEQPNVARVNGMGEWDADTVLTYAAAAEYRQPHPIAKAIVAEASARGLVLPVIESAKYQVGYGIKVWVHDHLVRVGSGRFMEMEGIAVPFNDRRPPERLVRPGPLAGDGRRRQETGGGHRTAANDTPRDPGGDRLPQETSAHPRHRLRRSGGSHPQPRRGAGHRPLLRRYAAGEQGRTRRAAPAGGGRCLLRRGWNQ